MPAAPQTHIALLRAINVGGHRSLPMAALRKLVEALGGTDVRTYIQSGNVVFCARAAVARAMATNLETAIGSQFGFHTPVITRSARELEAVLEGCPFDLREPRLLHVAFLSAPPDTEARLDPKRAGSDLFEVRGREVYLRLANGVGKTKLDNGYLERALGVTSTMRNWRTITTLCQLASG